MKSEERKNIRFPHASAVTREDVVSGIHYGANMYNYSKNGLYFEADYLLEPDDDIFIAAALEGNADFIVSLDHHLRSLKHYRGIQIVSPEQFLRYLRQFEKS